MIFNGSLNNNRLIAGYYGAISSEPQHIQDNMLRDFTSTWADWSNSIIRSLGFEDDHRAIAEYLASPVYRYTLSAGVCGELPYIGVMLPSLDSNGAPFPFTICAPLHKNCNPFTEQSRFEDWYLAAEKSILSSREPGFESSELEAWMLHLDKIYEEISVQPPSKSKSPNGNGQLAIRVSDDGKPPTKNSYQNLLNTLLSEVCFAYSIWRTPGNQSVAPSMLLSQGLPPIQSASAMFDGNWVAHGWHDQHQLHWSEDEELLSGLDVQAEPSDDD